MATINPIAPPRACSGKPRYEADRALGRTGYRPPPIDRLGLALEHLDGLLCLLTSEGDVTEDGDDGNDFQRLNQPMQMAVLGLASDLAHEVHELHLQVNVFGEPHLSALRDGGRK